MFFVRSVCRRTLRSVLLASLFFHCMKLPITNAALWFWQTESVNLSNFAETKHAFAIAREKRTANVIALWTGPTYWSLCNRWRGPCSMSLNGCLEKTHFFFSSFMTEKNLTSSWSKSGRFRLRHDQCYSLRGYSMFVRLVLADRPMSKKDDPKCCQLVFISKAKQIVIHNSTKNPRRARETFWSWEAG